MSKIGRWLGKTFRRRPGSRPRTIFGRLAATERRIESLHLTVLALETRLQWEMEDRANTERALLDRMMQRPPAS